MMFQMHPRFSAILTVIFYIQTSFISSCRSQKKPLTIYEPTYSHTKQTDESSYALVEESGYAVLGVVSGVGFAGSVTLVEAILEAKNQRKQLEQKRSQAFEEATFNQSNVEKYMRADPKVKKMIEEVDQTALRELLKERQKTGGSEKLNVLVLDIRLGGGHKAATDAITKSLTKGNSDLIKVGRADFFGDGLSGELSAREFNKILQEERGQDLNTGGKKTLERFYDSKVGQAWVKRSIEAGLKRNNMAKPDVIICAQPFGIHAISKISQGSFGAQVRVIPTDFAIGDWVQRMETIKSDNIAVRYDLPADHPMVKEQIKKAQIFSDLPTGAPIRKEISDFSDELHSKDPLVRKATQYRIRKNISKMSKGKFNFETDRSLLIMLGAKGAASGRYINYAKLLALSAEDTLKSPDGKLHVFLAQTEDLTDVQKTVHELKTKYPKAPIEFHLLGKVDPEQVGSLISQGVVLTKGGGATSAEITALGGRALINTRITNFAPWEAGNLKYMKQLNMAVDLPHTDLEEAAVFSKKLKEAFALKPAPVNPNRFHSIYQGLVIKDSIKILEQMKKLKVQFKPKARIR